DTLLNEIWSTKIGGSRHELSPPYLAPLPDGGYVTSFTVDTVGGWWSFISKYDDTGKRLWKHNLVTYYGKYNGSADAYNTYRIVYGFNTAKNGDILVHGWATALRLNGEYDKTRYVPWIARMDTKGNFLWERYLMENIDHVTFKSSLVDIMENSEGNLMLVGDYEPYRVDTTQLANRQFSFVVQLDSEGCFTPGCDSLTFLGLEYVTNIKELEFQSIQKLKLYPNPTSEYITIDIGQKGEEYKWELIDILGYVVKRGKGFGKKRLDISNLKSGLYILCTKTADGKLGIGKFIVEKN
ncbi:MAG TPA: T9SS type A sorting domain-containing protein, partial [Bacteroidetes bacterium]|nr:T9SS type A sorting domain-containing protein [Bacteroidota bacterium]